MPSNFSRIALELDLKFHDLFVVAVRDFLKISRISSRVAFTLADHSRIILHKGPQSEFSVSLPQKEVFIEERHLDRSKHEALLLQKIMVDAVLFQSLTSIWIDYAARTLLRYGNDVHA